MNTKAVQAVAWIKADVGTWIKNAGKIDPFTLIGKEWMLVGAGTASDWNAMTASWGGLGHLWNMNVAFCFVRPQRHTFGYTEKADRIVLSFFPETQRKALNYFGAHSGRDEDKAAKGGLSPISFDDGSVSFDEARIALVCRKLYAQKLNESCVIDPAVKTNYPKNDYHTMYVGEIEAVWMKAAYHST
ncbi:flavin reductase [Treponema sp.]